MNNLIKIVADDKVPFLKGILEPYADVKYYPGNEISKEKIKDADALIIRTRTKCNSDLLSGTNVKLITTATIGTDHIDLQFCERNKIKWINAPGCNALSVMQYVTSAILSLAKLDDMNLTEKTIGIVGVGNVGAKILKIAELLGMNVLLNDPPRERKEGSGKFCNLNKVLKESDIITFHVPLIRDGRDQTMHLGNDDLFNKLERKPILINSSRGEVIDSSALKNAIKNKKVSRTVLDVWENEPNIDRQLLELVDLATPHIAGYSIDGKANGTSVCITAISSFFGFNELKKWYPDDIPLPESGNHITINCNEEEWQTVLYKIINETYSINEDDKVFRNSPETFEHQRGNYPVRREFHNYNLSLTNCIKSISSKLEEIGFNIVK